MKRINILATKVIVLSLFFSLGKQAALNGQVLSKQGSPETTTKAIEWLTSLYQQGFQESGDSVSFSPEVIRLLNDSIYREQTYPKKYSWEMASMYIKRQDLRKAFWYMINLFMVNDQNRDAALKGFIAYDQIFKMDKILTGTFYTYIMADPEINLIRNGESKVIAPHKMEAKLKALKDILGYMEQFRATTVKKSDEKKADQP